MRKFLLATLAVALFAGMAMAQHADLASPVNVQVTIGGVWQLTLDVAAINFGIMIPGDNGSAAVNANIRTNQKVAWYLKLNKDQDLTHSLDVTEIIPSANLTYTGSGGAGTWANGQFNLAPTTAYSCAAAEYKCMGLGLNLATTLAILIPDPAMAGTYTNTITYTLTATP
jgi:opacity protein-like surface antigen